jgi:hypothetical protein
VIDGCFDYLDYLILTRLSFAGSGDSPVMALGFGTLSGSGRMASFVWEVRPGWVLLNCSMLSSGAVERPCIRGQPSAPIQAMPTYGFWCPNCG